MVQNMQKYSNFSLPNSRLCPNMALEIVGGYFHSVDLRHNPISCVFRIVYHICLIRRISQIFLEPFKHN